MDKEVKPPVNQEENTSALAKYSSHWEEHGFLSVCINCIGSSHLQQMDRRQFASTAKNKSMSTYNFKVDPQLLLKEVQSFQELNLERFK